MPQEYENYAGIIGRICACNDDVVPNFGVMRRHVQACERVFFTLGKLILLSARNSSRGLH